MNALNAVLYVCLMLKDGGNLFGSFKVAGEEITLVQMPGSHVGLWTFSLRQKGDYNRVLGKAEMAFTVPAEERKLRRDKAAEIGVFKFTMNNADEVAIPMYYRTASTGRPIFINRPPKAPMPFFDIE